MPVLHTSSLILKAALKRGVSLYNMDEENAWASVGRQLGLAGLDFKHGYH